MGAHRAVRIPWSMLAGTSPCHSDVLPSSSTQPSLTGKAAGSAGQGRSMQSRLWVSSRQ